MIRKTSAGLQFQIVSGMGRLLSVLDPVPVGIIPVQPIAVEMARAAGLVTRNTVADPHVRANSPLDRNLEMHLVMLKLSRNIIIRRTGHTTIGVIKANRFTAPPKLQGTQNAFASRSKVPNATWSRDLVLGPISFTSSH